MTLLTREEFLNYVHSPLSNPDGDPPTGSPTKSTMRYRWRELHHWNVEAEAREYWAAVRIDDKQARLTRVRSGFWEDMREDLEDVKEPFTSEASLQAPFAVAFRIGHNRAIRGASDHHAEMRSETGGLQGDPVIGNSDLVFVHENRLVGIIELKTWWKVTETEISEVKNGIEPVVGTHHGRLAIEQAYGYMVHDKITYGIVSTFNAFIFLKRASPGILYMSHMIPNTTVTPTIMHLLYFFSYLCARDAVPNPEINAQGIEVHLKSADKSTSVVPKVPNPNINLAPRDRTANTNIPPTEPRRSPRRHPGTSDGSALFLDISDGANSSYLGCKGWRGSLSTGDTVFVKLWDGWKFSRRNCDHEAAIYLQLRDLWGTMVPEYLGNGNWGFCHILLLSYVDSPTLYQVKGNARISQNVLTAFHEIHSRRIRHGDVRPENILVRPDNSVVIVDFEASEMNVDDQEILDAEMDEVKTLVGRFPRIYKGLVKQ